MSLNLPIGIYIATIKQGDITSTKRLIVK
ncbi:hypothetical protein [Ekhidna sp.]